METPRRSKAGDCYCGSLRGYVLYGSTACLLDRSRHLHLLGDDFVEIHHTFWIAAWINYTIFGSLDQMGSCEASSYREGVICVEVVLIL